MASQLSAIGDDLASDNVAIDPVVVPLSRDLLNNSICLETIWSQVSQGGDPNHRPRSLSLSQRDLFRHMATHPDSEAQYSSLRSYYTDRFHLARARGPVTEGTFDGYMKTLREYWGYLDHYEAEPTKAYDFTAAVLDGPKLLRFVAFRMTAQGNKVSTVTKLIFDLKAIMRWCISVVLVDDTERAAAKQLYAHVDLLNKQLRDSAPLKQHVDLEQREQDGRWLPWSDLRAMAEAYVSDTLDAVNALSKKSTRPDNVSPDVVELSLRLNKCLFYIIFCGGLDTGPQRPFTLKSLVLVGVNGSGDDQPGGAAVCSVCPAADVEEGKKDAPRCTGNVIRKVVNHRTGETEFVFNTTHHKTGNKTLQVIPPVKVTQKYNPLGFGVLVALFAWGHTVMVNHFDPLRIMSAADRMRAFRTVEAGNVFRVHDNSDNLPSIMVSRLVAELAGKSMRELHITCNTLRRMYVEWARKKDPEGGDDSDALTADELQGAALAMGSSVQMFDTVYQESRRESLLAQSRARVRSRYTNATNNDTKRGGVVTVRIAPRPPYLPPPPPPPCC